MRELIESLDFRELVMIDNSCLRKINNEQKVKKQSIYFKFFAEQFFKIMARKR